MAVPEGTGGNSASTPPNTLPVDNNTTSNSTPPGLSLQNDSANYNGCYTDDYTPVSNFDQKQCMEASYNWVTGFANVGAKCKEDDGCREAVNKAVKERNKKKAQDEINQHKQKLTSACSVKSKATDCWNFSGDGTEYTQSSGAGSGTWSTLSQMYSDCRITTDKNMGDALSDGNKDLTTLVGKNFRCQAKMNDKWYECSIKTTNSHDTQEHVEFTCPTSSEIKNGLAQPMSDEQIKSMDSENKSAYGDDNDDDTCEQSLFGLGWILCPLKELIVGGIDGFMNWISDKLDTQILIGNSGSAVKDVTKNFITYGNIILTIVFIIMIYSMATSTGMSNYSIKTILPRLVIVAIAINLSFYVCAALVDISNIAGHGMYSLLCGGDGCKDMQSQTTVLSISNILGAGINMMMAILCLVLFGSGAIISFLIIIICIEFREIALAIMTIIAPVAIALYLLPNTQNWAQRWFKIYTQLLFVYPLFTGMLGGAQLIGSIMMADNTTGIPNFLIALGCDIAPAIGVVPLFRASGGLIDKVAGSLAKNNPLTRGGARMVGAGAGAIASRRNGRGFIGRNAAHLQSSAMTLAGSKEAEAVGFQTKLAETAKTNVSNMSGDDLQTLFRTGRLANGKQADRYTMAAAADAYKGIASPEDWREAMTMARQRASELKNTKHDEEGADKLLNAYSSAAKDSDTFYGSTKGFKDLNEAWDYDTSLIKQGANASANSVAGMSNDQIEAINSAVMNSNDDKAIENWQRAAGGALNDKDLRNQMSIKQQQTLRSVSGSSVMSSPNAAEQQTQTRPQNGNSQWTTAGEARAAAGNLQSAYSAVNQNQKANIVQEEGDNYGRYQNTEDVQKLAEAENKAFDAHKNAQTKSEAERILIKAEQNTGTSYR